MSPSLPLPCDPQDNVSGSLHGNTKMTHFRYVNERHSLLVSAAVDFKTFQTIGIAQLSIRTL